MILATQQSTAEQVNQVIDKLASKLGVAAIEVQPFAERLIREFQVRAIVGLICSAGVTLLVWAVVIVLARYCFRQQDLSISQGKTDECWGPFGVGLSIIGFLLSLIPIGIAIRYLMQTVAPTYYCLQMLLR